MKGEKEKKNEEGCKGHWIFKSLGSDFSTQGVGLQGSGHVTIMAAPLSSAFLESEAAVSDKSTDPGYL